jgi:high frequency lysogenization protein
MALAGVYQAAQLTQQIARRGMADTQAMSTSIGSLFKVDSSDVSEVYGGIAGIGDGLRLFRDQLSGSKQRDVELTRYIIALIQLEHKLSKHPDMLASISREIQEATRRLQHFPLLHPNILSHLAAIYKQSISALQPKIMVKGEPLHLQNPDNINKIRALLLAGIRSAMLWRQVGGLRRQIIFNRRKLINVAHHLVASAEAGPS